jgi:NhaP-type Na+/H+ or K+/H+ antiporter
MAHHWKSLFYLLVPVMTWGWFVSAGLIYALIPGLNFLSSLAVAACLTPTDPILAAAVVGGKYADKHVPAHIRHLLAAESGCNDGAAFPFLFIALYLIIDSPHTGAAIQEWFITLWLYEVILGCVIGALIGFAFRHLMKFCQRHNLIDRHSYVAQYISLALFTIGATTLIGSDDLLAAFACGTAFAWDGFFNKQTEESVFSSVIDLLFNIAAFIFVGAWIPFSSFRDTALNLTVWRLIVIAILVLLLRRLPIMIALYKFIPDVKTFQEAMFSGHFGPIGIGAIFISTLAAEKLHDSNPEEGGQTALLANSIQPIVSFMVLCSIIIHGLSIPSFSLGRRVHTVSRTWSRHAPPDWTNQATLVDRGAANIIINRDRDVDVERGELSPDETLSEKQQTHEGEASDSQSASATEVSHAEKPEVKEQLEAEETKVEMHEELPVNGTVINEWQEGHHLVIERCTGPGQDVEVEVVRIPHQHDEGESSTFSGPAHIIHTHLDAAMNKLRSAPHALEKNVSKTADAIREDVHKLHDEAMGKTPPDATPEDSEDDSDGGWASDQSGTAHKVDRDSGSTSMIDRGKSGKEKVAAPVPGPPPPVRKRRRRNSIRRGLMGSAHDFIDSEGQASPASLTTDDSDGSIRRGRLPLASARMGSARPSTAPGGSSRTAPNTRQSSGSSPRHLRLESVRTLDSRSQREESPSRSIRFADDGRLYSRSGASTSRLSTFQNDSTPEALPESPIDDKNKVTFDLSKAKQ